MMKVLRLNGWLALLLLFAVAGPSVAETFSYEIYAMDRSGRKLLSKGQKNHTRADIRVTTKTALFKLWIEKQLDLGDGFSVGFADGGEPGVEGIGLWMRRAAGANSADAYPSFSWEWYNRESGGVFRKLQGKGKIQIQTQAIANHEFVTRVEFLDETVFRMQVDPGAKAGEFSHTMVIKRGSMLVFPATGDPVR